MCIRDSHQGIAVEFLHQPVEIGHAALDVLGWIGGVGHAKACLLYTSDAADERSSVDLGGRRIIKKQHKYDMSRHLHND